MATYAQQLADFVYDTPFEQLPPEVVDYTKLVILDCLICRIAAGSMERVVLGSDLSNHMKILDTRVS